MPVTEYIWDEDNDSLLMETDGDGNPTAVYTNTPDPYGELISQHRDGQTYFHHYDGEANTRQVTDNNQNIVEQATYTAFGEIVEKTSSIINPFGYKGALGYYFYCPKSVFVRKPRVLKGYVACDGKSEPVDCAGVGEFVRGRFAWDHRTGKLCVAATRYLPGFAKT